MSIEVRWSPRAATRLGEIKRFVALDKPEAAERLITRIVAMAEVLKTHPNLGRIGNDPGTRELVIAGTPYILIYRIRRHRVIVTTAWHGARLRGH